MKEERKKTSPLSSSRILWIITATFTSSAITVGTYKSKRYELKIDKSKLYEFKEDVYFKRH